MNAVSLKSVGAVVAGLVSNVVLTVSTDLALSVSGLLPPFGTGYSDAGLLSLALAYRAVFAGVGGFLTARLASHSPRRHVAWLMAIGLLIGLLSAVGGRAMFPAWYLLGIVALSVPATWLGGAAAAAPRMEPPIRPDHGGARDGAALSREVHEMTAVPEDVAQSVAEALRRASVQSAHATRSSATAERLPTEPSPDCETAN